jgi:methionine-gamma-lyase
MPGISTDAVHADRDVHPSRAVAQPIYQTAAFWAEDAEQFAQAAVDQRGHGFYTRYGNPNHAQVAAVVTKLERTEAAMVTASGMAALSTAVLALVSAGDHVIGQVSTYGGTGSVLLNLLPRLGVSTTQVDQTDPEAFAQALMPQTRLILLETPSNPLLQITDLRAVADLARAHGVLTLADNTFATPVNQRPAEFGIDLVWHSATKYLNGHSDVSAGVLAGQAEILDRVWDTALLTGAVLGPFDAWLLLRGLRTLPLRVARHNANGQALAEALESHPAVARVHYPGLRTHPQHEADERIRWSSRSRTRRWAAGGGLVPQPAALRPALGQPRWRRISSRAPGVHVARNAQRGADRRVRGSTGPGPVGRGHGRHGRPSRRRARCGRHSRRGHEHMMLNAPSAWIEALTR